MFSQVTTIQKNSMTKVYGLTALLTVITAFVGYYVGIHVDQFSFLFTGWMKWVTLFSPLVFMLVLVALHDQLGGIGSLVGSAVFSVLLGVGLSAVLIKVSVMTVALAFGGATALFILMSLYGLLTKRNLQSLGDILMIALLAVIVVSIGNLFIGSSIAQTCISAISIVIFAGLTASDSQSIRDQLKYDNSLKTIAFGSISLYLNLINMALNLLTLIDD